MCGHYFLTHCLGIFFPLVCAHISTFFISHSSLSSCIALIHIVASADGTSTPFRFKTCNFLRGLYLASTAPVRNIAGVVLVRKVLVCVLLQNWCPFFFFFLVNDFADNRVIKEF